MNQIQLSHFKELEALIRDRPEGSIVHLPARVSVIKKSDALIFARGE